MTNNIFGGLQTQGLDQGGDVLGGSRIRDTNVYAGTVTLAYAGQSQGGARSLTFHIKFDDGGDYRETVYITNRQGQPYYEKDGKKSPLPGFTTANDLALLTTGQDLTAQPSEEKVVKLYDFDAKAEVPTKVQALTDIMGKRIKAGIVRNTVDKTAKNGAGEYVPTGETRDENQVDKFFHDESGKTVSEFINKSEPEFLTKWVEAKQGKVFNKAKGADAGKSGAPGQSSAPAGKGKSLFG